MSVTQSREVKWDAPLPPPDALEAFGRINTSFPDRIVRMAEQAAEHQREVERLAMKQQEVDHAKIFGIQTRAQWFAAGLAAIFATVGIAFALMGYPTAGASIIVGVVVGLAGAYLGGTWLAGRKDESPKGKS